MVRHPGIEPGPSAWKADILTTELRALDLKTEAFDGIRTRDLSLTKRVLCQLSYNGTCYGYKRVHLSGIEPETFRV